MSLPFATAYPVGEVGHGVEDGVDLGHDILAVDDDRDSARRAQRDVQDRSIFGHVDLVSPEHGIDALTQAALLSQSAEQRDRLVRDAILGVVEVDAGRLRGQAFPACRVAGEERAQVPLADAVPVGFQRLPRLARGQWQYSRHCWSLNSVDTAGP